MTPGTVREFDPETGVGVIDAASTPGGCFVHFSVIAATGYRTLTAGQDVRFECEPAAQDGYAFHATRVVLRDGEETVRRTAAPPRPTGAP